MHAGKRDVAPSVSNISKSSSIPNHSGGSLVTGRYLIKISVEPRTNVVLSGEWMSLTRSMFRSDSA
ncbi:hypothetical protein PAXRUDRAFT_355345 [Paxillus rubicundulus Ve08.2h10]|uniref:Uncharacterized protein n=1 Tax=Paxillus rubicundulus Ve08.2h10 TaxID=930991 RepID=A0A0D0E3Z2_9AGAM|nr:hypothetical protein PAXRUDRAFT_355345 [Paxillus rubicundulus Ve08.2h10]